MKYGEVCRFYGNQCEHYTLPNEEISTRVSLDIRVTDTKYFDNDYISPVSGKLDFTSHG